MFLHRFSHKWQLRKCEWNFRVYKKPLFMKTPMKCKNLGDLRICNYLDPGRCGNNFNSMMVKLIIPDSSLGTRCETPLRWMPQNLSNEKSTLVQVMAWCHQATSHYLSQCWPRSMLPYGVIRPQWVNCPYKIRVHGWLPNTCTMFDYFCHLSQINSFWYCIRCLSVRSLTKVAKAWDQCLEFSIIKKSQYYICESTE